MKIKICHFLFKIFILGCLGQEGLIKFFILGFSELLVSKPFMGSYIAIRKKIILKLSFLILNTILYFLMLMNSWQFHLSNWQVMGLVLAISVFVYTRLLCQGIPKVKQA